MSATPPDTPTMTLVERAQAADETAMEHLFQRFLPRVRRIAAIRLGNSAQELIGLDDLVQEALLDAFRGLDGFDTCTDGRLVGWLSRIVENRIRMMLRDGRAQKRGGGRVQQFADESRGPRASAVPAAGPTPSQHAIGNETEARIRACLDELPANQREAVILRFFCNLPYDDVASELQLASADHARALYSRALKQLGSRARTDESC